MSNILGYNGGRFYSSLVKPVLADCSFVVDATNGLGITGLKGALVQNVFMHTSTTPTRGPNGYLNPNPASGYALIQLKSNYGRYVGGFNGFVSPSTGGNLAINGSALTAGVPYVISSVGHASAGTVTVAPVADVSGSLASTWFRLFDAYGNTFIVWFSVSGTGSAPQGVSGTPVQVQLVTNDSAATVGAKLVVVLNGLLATQLLNPSGPAGVFSFTTSGTTTVTIVSTATNPYGPLPGVPADGIPATGFTMAQTVYSTNLQDWQGVGLPKGIIPAVGVSFIATATGYSTGGGSTGTVVAAGSSGISSIEVVGDPNMSMAPIPMSGSPNVGGWVLVKFLGQSFAAGAYTPAGTISAGVITVGAGTSGDAVTNLAGVLQSVGGEDLAVNTQTFTGTAASLTGTISLAAAAPTAGSLVRMAFYLEQSSVLIAGE